MQTMIRFKRHEIIQATIEKQIFFGLNFKEKLALPSIKDLKKTNVEYQMKDVLMEEDIEMGEECANSKTINNANKLSEALK